MKRVAAGMAIFFVAGSSLFAQVTRANRTFVSAGAGSDLNSCSRAEPCRSFAAALAMTNAGGEVIVLDSGGYGSCSIEQAVSIESPSGVYAGVTVSSGVGVYVTAGSGDRVVLKGLTIVVTGGTHGIYFAGGSALVVEGCDIAGGIDNIVINCTGRLAIRRCSFSSATDSGVMVAALPAEGARVTIDGCWFSGNLNGVIAGSGGTVLLSNSVIEGSANLGTYAAGGNLNSVIVIENCRYAYNNYAVRANSSVSGGFGTIYISGSTIAYSTNAGLSQINGGVVYSRQNNTIEANHIDVSGNIGALSGK